MSKNSSILEARPQACHIHFKALRRESGLFLPYLEETLRILSLNALKSPYGDRHHGSLSAFSETKFGNRRVRNQFVNRT